MGHFGCFDVVVGAGLQYLFAQDGAKALVFLLTFECGRFEAPGLLEVCLLE